MREAPVEVPLRVRLDQRLEQPQQVGQPARNREPQGRHPPSRAAARRRECGMEPSALDRHPARGRCSTTSQVYNVRATHRAQRGAERRPTPIGSCEINSLLSTLSSHCGRLRASSRYTKTSSTGRGIWTATLLENKRPPAGERGASISATCGLRERHAGAGERGSERHASGRVDGRVRDGCKGSDSRQAGGLSRRHGARQVARGCQRRGARSRVRYAPPAATLGSSERSMSSSIRTSRELWRRRRRLPRRERCTVSVVTAR
jgi:hypothetical protein